MTPGKAKIKTGLSLSRVANMAPRRASIKIAGSEHALHVDLVHAPIEEPAVKRAENDSDEGIVGVVVGPGDMHRMWHSRDEGVPSADLAKADQEHQAAAGDHDGGLNRVSVGDRRESADDGDCGDTCAHEHYHGHHVPTQQTMQHERAGIQMERQLGHDADDQHEPGEEDARGAVVAEFEEFRNGVHTGADVVGKQHGAGDAEADASREFDGAGGEAVAIRIAGEADQVFGADVGGEKGSAHQGPAQPAAGEKELRAGFACALRMAIMSPVAMLAITAMQQTTMSSAERAIPILGKKRLATANDEAERYASWCDQRGMV